MFFPILSSINSSLRLWIIDLEASKNIFSNANVFVSLKPIWNSLITLPNNVQILVSMCGDVQLSVDLILKDVLFIPEFKFNLISVAAFTTNSQFMVHLLPNHFIIQDLRSKKMIGKGNKLEGLYVLSTYSFKLDCDSDNGKSILTTSSICINIVTARVWQIGLDNLLHKDWRF